MSHAASESLMIYFAWLSLFKKHDFIKCHCDVNKLFLPVASSAQLVLPWTMKCWPKPVTLYMRNFPLLFDGAWTWLLLSTWSFDSWFFRVARKYINTYVILVLCEQEHTRCSVLHSYESCFTVIRYEGLCGSAIICGLGSLATDLIWTNDTFTS